MTELNDRESELVALGAALASNCLPCIEYHVPAARKAGLSNAEIEAALHLADKVRRAPARLVLESALARAGGDGPAVAGCGCDGRADDAGGEPECAG